MYGAKKIDSKKVWNDGKFSYITIGDGEYDHSQRIWISRGVSIDLNKNGEEIIKMPKKGISIEKGKKNYIMRNESNEKYYYNIGIYAGYRGDVERFVCMEGDGEIVVHGEHYNSPRGNLGIDDEYIIYGDGIWEYEIAGRTYGDPKYGVVILRGGEVEIYPGMDYEEYLELN